MTRNRGVRPISMRLTLALTSLSLSLCTIGSASDESGTSLLDAARRAGTEASPLVFDRESETGAEVETDRRISGKTILLATTIASVAAVTVAWLLRDRNGCRPRSSFSRNFWKWTEQVSDPWGDTLPDGTRVPTPGPRPSPLIPPPGSSFPDLCVAH